MRLVLPLIALAAGLACDPGASVQSCTDDRANPSSCIEIDGFSNAFVAAGLQASLAVLCAAVEASPEPVACPEANRVAGCAGNEQDQYDYVEWQYTADDVQTPDDVTCNSDEEKVVP